MQWRSSFGRFIKSPFFGPNHNNNQGRFCTWTEHSALGRTFMVVADFGDILVLRRHLGNARLSPLVFRANLKNVTELY